MRSVQVIFSSVLLCLFSCSSIGRDFAETASKEIQDGLDKLSKGIVDGSDKLSPLAIKEIFQAYQDQLTATHSLENALRAANARLYDAVNSEDQLYELVATFEKGFACNAVLKGNGGDSNMISLRCENQDPGVQHCQKTGYVTSKRLTTVGSQPTLSWQFDVPPPGFSEEAWKIGDKATCRVQVTEMPTVVGGKHTVMLELETTAQLGPSGWNFERGVAGGTLSIATSQPTR